MSAQNQSARQTLPFAKEPSWLLRRFYHYWRNRTSPDERWCSDDIWDYIDHMAGQDYHEFVALKKRLDEDEKSRNMIGGVVGQARYLRLAEKVGYKPSGRKPRKGGTDFTYVFTERAVATLGGTRE